MPSCRWSRNSRRGFHAEDVFGRMACLPHCLFLDSAMAHPTLGRYSFRGCRSVRFRAVPGRRQRCLDGVGRAAAAVSPRPASLGCRRFRAAPPACWATISDAVWNACRRPRPTSSMCPPWPSGCTTWSWRSTMWPAGRGSSHRGSRRSNLRAAGAVPPSGSPSFAIGLLDERQLGWQLHCHPGRQCNCRPKRCACQ